MLSIARPPRRDRRGIQCAPRTRRGPAPTARSAGRTPRSGRSASRRRWRGCRFWISSRTLRNTARSQRQRSVTLQRRRCEVERCVGRQAAASRGAVFAGDPQRRPRRRGALALLVDERHPGQNRRGELAQPGVPLGGLREARLAIARNPAECGGPAAGRSRVGRPRESWHRESDGGGRRRGRRYFCTNLVGTLYRAGQRR